MLDQRIFSRAIMTWMVLEASRYRRSFSNGYVGLSQLRPGRSFERIGTQSSALKIQMFQYPSRPWRAVDGWGHDMHKHGMWPLSGHLTWLCLISKSLVNAAVFVEAVRLWRSLSTHRPPTLPSCATNLRPLEFHSIFRTQWIWCEHDIKRIRTMTSGCREGNR